FFSRFFFHAYCHHLDLHSFLHDALPILGNIAPEVMVPLQKIVTRQIRLQGSCASAGEYPRAMELLESGAIQVKNLITAIAPLEEDRKSTRLNSSHLGISYAVFCLKKKKR